MSLTPGILARGPWALEHVEVHWRADRYEPPGAATEAADAAISALRERGSDHERGQVAMAARVSVRGARARSGATSQFDASE